MKAQLLLSLLCVFAASLAPSAAHADWFQQLVRSTGLGWSDGYHAYAGCPRCGPQPPAWSEAEGPHFPLWGESSPANSRQPTPAIRRETLPPADPSAALRGPVRTTSLAPAPSQNHRYSAAAAYYEAAARRESAPR